MAIYHCSIKKVQRSNGRSSTAAAAYRAREQIVDERQGMTFDYSSKDDLQHSEIIGFDGDRSTLWNAAEQAEKRKDAVTAVEYEVAIPRELSKSQRIEMVREYGQWLNDRHGVAVDFAIHTDKNDNNPHAHILTTTRAPNGQALSGVKVAREWSDTKRKQNGYGTGREEVKEVREHWATVANKHLELAQQPDRIDHRSHQDRGLDTLPSIKLGHAVIGQERQGIHTDRGSRAIAVMETNDMINRAQALTLEIQPHERRTSTQQPEHDRGTTQSAELRRTGGQDRTVRPEHGTTGGRLEGGSQSDQENHQGIGQRNVGTDAHGISGRDNPNERTERSGQNHDQDQSNIGQQDTGERTKINKLVANIGVFSQRVSSGYGRIMALAETVRERFDDARMGRENQSRVEQSNTRETSRNQRTNGMENRGRMKNDRTTQAVRQQLKAMDCGTYDIGVIGAKKDGKAFHFQNRTTAQVMAEIPNLKRLNAQGRHIYIQPAEDNHKMVLVDDVSFDDIENMSKNGHKPALTVETSPDNYQAWVKSPKSITEDERASVAMDLANIYDADKNSAQKRHYGRLAGFTNQKEEHEKHGRYPFALLRSSTGEVAKGLDPQIEQARTVSQKAKDTERENMDYFNGVGTTTRKGDRMAKGSYESLQEKYKREYQPSEADWMVAKHLMKSKISKEETAKLIAKHSPNIEERKRTVNVEKYVNLTVTKAAEKLQQENPNIKIKERQESISRGMSGPER